MIHTKTLKEQSVDGFDWSSLESRESSKEYTQFQKALEESFENYNQFGVGDLVNAEILSISPKTIVLDGGNKSSITIDVPSEKSLDGLMEDLEVGDMMRVFINCERDGCLNGTLDGVSTELTRLKLLDSVTSNDYSFDAKVEELVSGGYMVNIDGNRAFLPGSLAAPNKLTDFTVLLGETVKVMPEVFDTSKSIFVVSHKKWLEHELPKMIDNLDMDTRLIGKVTGVKHFGIFIEFDEYFTGLLHKSEMDDDTLSSMESYRPDEEIHFWVKSVEKKRGQQRIILTQFTPEERAEQLAKKLEKLND